MTDKQKLTDKQKRFCEHYARNLNATAAAKAAGYSIKTAYSIGCELLKRDPIRQRIEELTSAERTKNEAEIIDFVKFCYSVMIDDTLSLTLRLNAADHLAKRCIVTKQAQKKAESELLRLIRNDYPGFRFDKY